MGSVVKKMPAAISFRKKMKTEALACVKGYFGGFVGEGSRCRGGRRVGDRGEGRIKEEMMGDGTHASHMIDGEGNQGDMVVVELRNNRVGRVIG